MSGITPAEADVRAITKVVPKAGEERGRYLDKLARAANALPDPDWESLTPDAQHWGSKAIEAIQRGRPVPEFEGHVAAPVTEGEYLAPGAAEEPAGEKEPSSDDEATQVEAATKPKPGTKKGGKGKPKVEAKPKTPKAKVEKKAKEPKAPKEPKVAKDPGEKNKRRHKPLNHNAISVRMKQALIQDPEMTPKDLYEAMEKEGFTGINMNSVITYRNDFFHSVRALYEAGLLNEKSKFTFPC